MKFSRTSFFGWVAAAALSADGIAELPHGWHLWARAIAAVAVALVGYHATDAAPPASGAGRGPLLGLLIASILILTGCQMAQVGFGVKSPTFGEASLTVGGGVIGRPGPLPAASLLCPVPTTSTNAP